MEEKASLGSDDHVVNTPRILHFMTLPSVSSMGPVQAPCLRILEF